MAIAGFAVGLFLAPRWHKTVVPIIAGHIANRPKAGF